MPTKPFLRRPHSPGVLAGLLPALVAVAVLATLLGITGGLGIAGGLGHAMVPAALAHDIVPADPQERPVLLRGGDLYTVSDGVLEATDLLFVDGRIAAIGENLEAPEGAEVIDVGGKRVYPGLVAADTSIGLVEIGAVRATVDTAEEADVSPEAAAHVAYNPDSEIIPTVRAHGIAIAQVVPGGSLLRGRSFVTRLDGWTREDAGIVPVDALHLSWPRSAVIDAWWMSASAEEQKQEMEEERAALRRAFDDARAYLEARRADPSLPTDLRWESMVPVLTGDMPLHIHADDERQILEALAFADEQGIDLVLVGAADAHRMADLLAERSVPVILGPVQAVPERDDEPYDTPFTVPRVLDEAGVTFAFGGTGSWSTRNLPFQPGHALAFGLDPATALRAVTLTPAEILGIAEDYGSLEVGKSATLFVSAGDVLDVVGQDVEALWIDGAAIDLDNRHRQLWRKYQEKEFPVGSGG